MKFDKTVGLAVASVAVGSAILIQSVKIHRSENAKRVQIQKDMKLDLEAIRRAGEICQIRMRDDDYFHRGLGYIMTDLNNEIEFQKIAIREEV